MPVTAFGAAIKPIAHDNLLSVPQTMKYNVLVIVPIKSSDPAATNCDKNASMMLS